MSGSQEKTALELACDTAGVRYNSVLFSPEPALPAIVFALADLQDEVTQLKTRVEKLEEDHHG